jgi:hypothetical protein
LGKIESEKLMCDYYISKTLDEDAYCSFTGQYFMDECPIDCEQLCPLITGE